MRGTVYRYEGKHGDIWCIRYDLPHGKGQPRRQRHESLPGLNKTQAERYLADVLRRLRYGPNTEPCRTTFAEFLSEWLDRIQDRVSPTTWEGYSKVVRKHVIPALGDIPVCFLSPPEIQAYYDRLSRSKILSPKSIRNLHGIIRSALSSAVRLQLIERNPAEDLELPRLLKKEAKTATEAEVVSILQAFRGSKYQLPLIIAFATGVRRGEALALRWEDYNEKASELVIRHSLAQTKGRITLKETKTGKTAPVPIPASLVALLDAQRRRQVRDAAMHGYKVDGWICTDPRTGKPLTPQGLTRAFSRVAESLGIDVVFHGLRHTHATDLLEEGVPLKVVSERVRHSNIHTTADRYAHVTPTMQQAAVKIAEDKLSRVLHEVVDGMKPPDPEPSSPGGAEIVRIFPEHPRS